VSLASLILPLSKNDEAFFSYLDEQIQRLNSENELTWRQSIEPLILALPWTVPRLVKAVKSGRVRLDRASAFADTLSLHGAVEESEKIFRAVKERDPGNAAHLNNLAVVLLKTGDKEKIEEAVGLLNKAVELDAQKFGDAARTEPAYRNRDIALSLLRVSTKASPERASEEPGPGTFQALEKQILHEYRIQAGAETVLEICGLGLKYIIPLLLGVILPLSLFIGLPLGFSLNSWVALIYVIIVVLGFVLVRYVAAYFQKKATMRIGSYLPHYNELTKYGLVAIK
jgi:tetratricopeptide (TPR) repeat protein